MELFIHIEARGRWEPVANLLQGLCEAARTGQDTLLVSRQPVDELGDLLAAAWLLERSGGSSERLAVASPYPSLAWIAPLRDAGVKRCFAVPATPELARRVPLEALVEVPRDPCPALTVSGRRGESLCVCGRQRHGRVLCTGHFIRSCFSAWSACAAQEAPGVEGRPR